MFGPNETISEIEAVEIYMDGEYLGTANQTITNETGTYYAEDGEYIQDNGEYAPVGGNGIEAK